MIRDVVNQLGCGGSARLWTASSETRVESGDSHRTPSSPRRTAPRSSPGWPGKCRPARRQTACRMAGERIGGTSGHCHGGRSRSTNHGHGQSKNGELVTGYVAQNLVTMDICRRPLRHVPWLLLCDRAVRNHTDALGSARHGLACARPQTIR